MEKEEEEWVVKEEEGGGGRHGGAGRRNARTRTEDKGDEGQRQMREEARPLKQCATAHTVAHNLRRGPQPPAIQYR